MPFGSSHQQVITNLGRALKHLRNPGEQFCVFGFDLTEHRALEPDPAAVAKHDLPLDFTEHPNANWTAAFWSVTQPHHTEIAILERFEQWLSNYSGVYGAPRNLHVYSALIPCFRDGTYGSCSYEVQAKMQWVRAHYQSSLALRLGWSNNDVDPDTAHATMHGMADLEDDGIGVSLFPPSLGMSIAGPRVDRFGNPMS